MRIRNVILLALCLIVPGASAHWDRDTTATQNAPIVLEYPVVTFLEVRKAEFRDGWPGEDDTCVTVVWMHDPDHDTVAIPAASGAGSRLVHGFDVMCYTRDLMAVWNEARGSYIMVANASDPSLKSLVQGPFGNFPMPPHKECAPKGQWRAEIIVSDVNDPLAERVGELAMRTARGAIGSAAVGPPLATDVAREFLELIRYAALEEPDRVGPVLLGPFDETRSASSPNHVDLNATVELVVAKPGTVCRVSNLADPPVQEVANGTIEVGEGPKKSAMGDTAQEVRVAWSSWSDAARAAGGVALPEACENPEFAAFTKCSSAHREARRVATLSMITNVTYLVLGELNGMDHEAAEDARLVAEEVRPTMRAAALEGDAAGVAAGIDRLGPLHATAIDAWSPPVEAAPTTDSTGEEGTTVAERGETPGGLGALSAAAVALAAVALARRRAR